MKESICNFLKDVDIAPGRSRVAVVIFANEPIVYFGFDKYYSYKSIASELRKCLLLIYLQGVILRHDEEAKRGFREPV